MEKINPDDRRAYGTEYDRLAYLPKRETRWVWEVDAPHARALIEVVDVFWNGLKWWVETRSLLPEAGGHTDPVLNELGRFWQAATPVMWPPNPSVMEIAVDTASRERATT